MIDENKPIEGQLRDAAWIGKASADNSNYSCGITIGQAEKAADEIRSLRKQLDDIRRAIPKREYPPFLKVETLAHEALYLVEQVETYRDECEAIRTKLAEAEKRAEVAEAEAAGVVTKKVKEKS